MQVMRHQEDNAVRHNGFIQIGAFIIQTHKITHMERWHNRLHVHSDSKDKPFVLAYQDAVLLCHALGFSFDQLENGADKDYQGSY
jgi:hypothetical protein